MAAAMAFGLLAGCGRTGHEALVLAGERVASQVDQAVQVSQARTPEDVAKAAIGVTDVEVLKIDGQDPRSDQGMSIVIRVRVQPPGRPTAGTICYRLSWAWGHDGIQSDVRCPRTAPIQVTPDPRLPDDEAVRAALAGVAPNEQAVRAAAATLQLDPRVQVTVDADATRVGVAFRATPHDCILARVGRDGAPLEVWRPAYFQLAPGQLTCSGTTALGGLGQRPPR